MRVAVCGLEELPEDASCVVEANGREVAVFNLAGEFFAIDNSCAHKQQPLAEGVVRDGIVTCPAHLWRYDVRTGGRVDSPGWSVACYATSVVDGDIVVDIPEPAPQQPIREQLLQHAREWSRDE